MQPAKPRTRTPFPLLAALLLPFLPAAAQDTPEGEPDALPSVLLVTLGKLIQQYAN